MDKEGEQRAKRFARLLTDTAGIREFLLYTLLPGIVLAAVLYWGFAQVFGRETGRAILYALIRWGLLVSVIWWGFNRRRRIRRVIEHSDQRMGGGLK